MTNNNLVHFPGLVFICSNLNALQSTEGGLRVAYIQMVYDKKSPVGNVGIVVIVLVIGVDHY